MVNRTAKGTSMAAEKTHFRGPNDIGWRPDGPRILADHRACECRWPVGPWPLDETADTSLALFCCAPAEEGGSYCPDHADIAYGRTAKGAQRRAA